MKRWGCNISKKKEFRYKSYKGHILSYIEDIREKIKKKNQIFFTYRCTTIYRTRTKIDENDTCMFVS